MKKKKQNKPKNIDIRPGKGSGGKTGTTPEKPVDDGWERLLKIREKLRKHSKATESSEKSSDEVMENLVTIGEGLGKGLKSEKSAVEILSEMRR